MGIISYLFLFGGRNMASGEETNISNGKELNNNACNRSF